jgi:hypothetical protein
MKLLRIAAAAIAAITFIACGGSGSKEKPEAESLIVTPTTLSLLPNASGTLQITSNVAWTVTPPSGFTASPTSGSKNGTVTVTAGGSPISGFLKVQGKTKSVTVALTAAESDVAVNPTAGTVSYEAGKTLTFQVVCNGDWTIDLPSPKPSWLIGVSQSSGSKDATITVTTGAYSGKVKDQTFLTVKSGKKSAYYTITKEAAPNLPPTKPTNLQPTGSNVETITTFSWTASTDPNGDKIKYTVMLSKDNSNWSSVGTTEKTSLQNTSELAKNTKYYYKVIADDGLEGGKTESDVVTFTTGNGKNSWADGEVKQYNVNSDGSITEVPLGSTPRGVRLIFTGDGYTQDLYNYGGQFDKEVDAGIKALFEYEPYKSYTSYFTVYKVAAYSNEAGMSEGSSYDHPTKKVDTKFKCTWEGGNSTGIDCDVDIVAEYAFKVPGIKGSSDKESLTNLTWCPVSIIINAYAYAGTNIWLGDDYGGMKMISIAQTPARQPSYGAYDGFAFTLRHEYGGHGFGLLDDEYVYYDTQQFPRDDEESFRYWQNEGAFCNTYLPQWNSSANAWYSDSEHCNLSLTPKTEGVNWKTFADRTDYAPAAVNLFNGSSYYGKGVYRSEYTSCMVDNIPHFNTISRWKIYCRIKISAGETPTLEDFVSRDTDRSNAYSSGAPKTKSSVRRKCNGPLLKDKFHKKPYRLHR